MDIWIFLLGLNLALVLPAINYYVFEKDKAYLFYIAYVIGSFLFFVFTFDKYNDYSLIPGLSIVSLYDYERLLNSAAIMFYYFFLYYFSLKSSRCKLYRKWVKIQIVYSFILLPPVLYFDINLSHSITASIVTLLLCLVSLLLNLYISLLVIRDKSLVFRIIGTAYFINVLFVSVALILYCFPGISSIIDNPHKLFLVATVIELILFNYALNYSNLEYREGMAMEVVNLEKAALQAQMNPHFIFNCLNSIQNFIMENNKVQAMDYLSRFAKLVRQNLNASVESKVSIEDEASMLDNYLALEKLRFKDRFNYHIHVDPNIHLSSTFILPLLIQPYVENAILHGMKEMESGGMINVNFKTSGDNILVTVEDNGMGISTDTMTHNASSLGMSITEKRLYHNNSSESPLSIRSDENGAEISLEIALVK